MGHQATVIIHLDALDTIAKDPDFGKKLAAAILDKANRDPQSDRTVVFNAFSGKCSENAGRVVEVHHADETVTILTGGGSGQIIRDANAGKKPKYKFK